MAAVPAKRVLANIKFGSAKDLPLLYAHQVLVNFTGPEFYATVYATAPEPWTTVVNPDVEARPLARFAFSPAFWVAFVQSAAAQITKLQEEGVLSEESLDQARKLLGQ
jgi:hypothetical protein